jgi:hypothetical protein
MVGDFIGRALPSLVILFSPKTVGIAVAARLLFFVLVVFCVYPKPYYIKNEWIYFAIMLVFGISNGYLGSKEFFELLLQSCSFELIFVFVRVRSFISLDYDVWSYVCERTST